MLTKEQIFVKVSQDISRDQNGLVLPSSKTVIINIIPNGQNFDIETVSTSNSGSAFSPHP
jgi:hypothetical protein